MKYELGVKNRLKDDNTDKEIQRNGKSGKSEIKVQIAKLEGVIVEAEASIEIAEEEYEASKFNMPFSLKKVDVAEHNLKNAQKIFDGYMDDLKNRKALLKELF